MGNLDSLTGREVILTRNHEIVAINLFTSQAQLILEVKDGNIFNAQWSPDHKKIAYLKTCSSQACGFELILIDKTGNQKTVTTSPVPQNDSYNPPGIVYNWKDASTLAYSVGKSSFKYNTETGESTSITSSIDDSHVSLDGKIKIESKDTGAILKNDDTKITKTLGDYPCAGYSVQFSEDSRRIAISSGCGGGGQVELFDANGNKLTTFPSDAMSSLLEREGVKDGALTGGQIAFSPDNQNIFMLASHTKVTDSKMLVTKYGFITDINGNNTKIVNVDVLGGTKEIGETENINSLSW